MKNKKGIIPYKMSYSGTVVWMKCPKCGDFSIGFAKGYLKVNCFANGLLLIKDFYTLFESCNNPTCEWSQVKPDKVFQEEESYY